MSLEMPEILNLIDRHADGDRCTDESNNRFNRRLLPFRFKVEVF